MQAASRCPGCGIAVRPDAPEGLCPECLLKEAMRSGSELGQEPEATAIHASGSIPPSLEELAPQFPQLEILELLGRGGMGLVYKARQPRLDRLVALKILPEEAGRDPAFAERFAREARALAKLAHPGIVTVHDFGESERRFYLLMEFVDGVNLRHLLRERRLKPEEALKIVPQICEALQYAHEQGVIHRDIKPENILLDRRGHIKIADFGLAKLIGPKAADSALTGSQQIMGTMHYMAPEQMERPLAVDHRADIYSLGVVFYEMLTGELPLGRFAPPSQKVRVDVRLDEVVLRALEKEPERRYQHASDVKQEVETITVSQPEHSVASVDQRQAPPGMPGLEVRSVREERSPQAAGFTIKIVKAFLLIIFACCLVLFLSFSGSFSPRGHRIQVGFPSPWFEAEGSPTGFNHHINLASWSWAIAALGALSCYLDGAIRRREAVKMSALDKFGANGCLLWLVIATCAFIVASLMAILMGTQEGSTTRKEAVGGLEGARPSETSALTSDGDRTWRSPEGTEPGGYRSAFAYFLEARGTIRLGAGATGSDGSRDGGVPWTNLGETGLDAVGFAGEAKWAVGEDGYVARLDTGGVEVRP